MCEEEEDYETSDGDHDPDDGQVGNAGYSLWSAPLAVWQKVAYFVRRFRHLPGRFWTGLVAAVLVLDLLSWTALSAASAGQRFSVLGLAVLGAAIWATVTAANNPTSEERVDVARDQYKRARELFDSGEYKRALDLVNEAIELDPEAAGNHTLAGRILVRQGRWREALPRLDAGARLSSIQANRTMCLTNIAIAQLMLHDTGAALRTLDQILKVEPRNSLVLRWKAIAWLCLNNTGSALECAREASSLRPKTLANPAILGVCQALSGDVEAAKRSLEKCQRQMPDGAEDYYYLGLLHASLGNRQDAIVALDIADTRDERFAHRRRSDPLLARLLPE